MKAKLIDLTRCTECRSCITACENWNRLGPHTVGKTAAEIRAAYKAGGEAWELSKEDWTVLKEKDPRNYYKRQCMHCDDPMCVKNCPAHAITKYDNGAVVVDKEKCEGVQMCVKACPFGVPQYDEKERVVHKCTLCYDRITRNPALEPACVKACPSKALKFGDRNDLLGYARKFRYVYGGGREYDSSVIYCSNKPLEEIGLEKASIHGIPSFLEAMIHPLGQTAIVAGAAYYGLAIIKARKEKIAELEGE